MNEKLYKLFRLQCQDLLVLADMEWNGMLYDSKAALEKASSLQTDIDEVVKQFNELVGNSVVSISSPDNLSAVLYGGHVSEPIKVAIGVYKSGARKGQVRYKNEEIVHTFPRLVQPLKDTETDANKKGKKETWGVGEDVLKKLKGAKELIALILKYRGLEKLRSTYLQGWADLIEENGWDKDYIHGNLNQCVAITGRLSSTQPNMQNPPKEVKQFLVSRYDNTS